jgi:molybdate transport system substrate-binding protein
MNRPADRWLVAVLVVPLLAAGCAHAGADRAESVTVFAAASLTGAFGEIRADFQRSHPGTRVVLSFASSATLAAQLRQGAPADVFAAADRRTMELVTSGGLAPADPPTFARNRLQIAVPADNPGRVRDLRDFGRDSLAIAVCAPSAPCGAAAQAAFRVAGVTARPDTYEKDVKAALAKVVLGEVDAALVYHTDVVAAGDTVAGIELPAVARVTNDYPVAVLRAAPNRQGARAFVGYLRADDGRRSLAAAGFEIP